MAGSSIMEDAWDRFNDAAHMRGIRDPEAAAAQLQEAAHQLERLRAAAKRLWENSEQDIAAQRSQARARIDSVLREADFEAQAMFHRAQRLIVTIRDEE